MLLSIAYIGGIATVPGVIFAGFALAPGGLVYTAMERWFHLGEYQPIVAGVGVIVSAILNPDGVDRRGELGASGQPAAQGRRRHRGSPRDDRTRPRRRARRMSPSARGRRVCGSPSAAWSPSTTCRSRSRTARSSGFIGPNGAGKTTCIEALTGYVPHATGRVVFDGHDLRGMAPHRRARLGLVRTFQAVELFDDLTVRDNLRAAANRRTWWQSLGDLVAPDGTTTSRPSTTRSSSSG